MANLAVWVQNSNVHESGVLFENGEVVEKERTIELIKKMVHVYNKGLIIHSESDREVVRYKNRYLLKIHSDTLDDYRRRMPVMILLRDFAVDNTEKILLNIIDVFEKAKYNVSNKKLRMLIKLISDDVVAKRKLRQIGISFNNQFHKIAASWKKHFPIIVVLLFFIFIPFYMHVYVDKFSKFLKKIFYVW